MSGKYIVVMNGQFVTKNFVKTKQDGYRPDHEMKDDEVELPERPGTNVVAEQFRFTKDKARAKWLPWVAAHEMAERIRVRFRAFNPTVEVQEVLTPQEIIDRKAFEKDPYGIDADALRDRALETLHETV